MSVTTTVRQSFERYQEVMERLEGISRGLLGNIEPVPGSRTLEDLNRREVNQLLEGTPRDRKDGSLLALQLAVDGFLEEEVPKNEYSEIRETSIENVLNYYRGERISEIKTPETGLETRESGLPGDEVLIEKWCEDLEHEEDEIDTVVAIASGGLEPGIVAADEYSANLDIVRYSSDRNDENVREIDTQQEYGDIMIVDDTSFTGESMNVVKDYFEPRSDSIETEAVIEGNKDKIGSLPPLFTRRRWKYQR